MKLSIEKNEENYAAVIIKVENLIELNGLDNLRGIPVFGKHALVSKDFPIGSLAVVFTSESQLSERFCERNNLYRHNEYNEDKSKTGYLEDNRRVRAIRLRGNPSSALALEIDSLSYLGDISKLKEGDQFTHINGEEVCRKYMKKVANPRGGNKTKGKNKKFERISTKTFPEHWSTPQLLRNLDAFDPSDHVYVTQKLHGCVKGDTLVETENGVQTIQEVVEAKNAKTVKSFDVNSQEVVFAPIGKYFYKPNDGEWFEIELENGQNITITGNNPVWLPDLGVYRRVDELKGDENILFDA